MIAVLAGIAVALLLAAFVVREVREYRASRVLRPARGPEEAPAGRESRDWLWPPVPAPFDADAYLAERRLARSFPPGIAAGTVGRQAWDPVAYEKSLAKAAVDQVFAEEGSS